MKFSILVASAFAALTIAAPTSKFSKRGSFTTTTYNALSISGGVAGNAKQEALDKLSALDLNNLAAADQSDLDFLNDVNSICNDAEKEAFNPAIKAATGTAADSLQIGKIKNKVLKLTATMLKLQIQAAQGKDTTAQQAAEQKKLDNNISQDVAAAGKTSTALQFDGTVTAA